MNCVSCGGENPDHAKFCLGCGARFGNRCASCSTELPEEARFCLECGTAVAGAAPPTLASAVERNPRDYTPKHLADKILRSKSAIEGERKQVTVLFADLKSSMEISEGIDAEQWHRIMERFFAILSEGIHRFEGTINQFRGDGVMAIFGAPISHEDHAQRACYAALHLKEHLRPYADELRLSHGISFSVRMGLNTGDVVVAKIGDDLRMDYTAQGHTTGLAARMEEIAEPGHIFLTEYTQSLAFGYFEFRSLGPLEIKGVEEPVRVFDLEGLGRLRTRLDISRARGFTRFVGRANEMQSLEGVLEQIQTGNGQIVGVMGEAGVGKSRLCSEFVERCRAKDILVYEAHCPSHGQTVPFSASLQILRAMYGIQEHDDPAEVRKKVAGTLLLLDESFHSSLPLMFDFLGVPDPSRPLPPMDPETRQRQLMAVFRELGQRRAEEEMSITFFDDLHWIDPGSEAFLKQYADALSVTKTLLLLNFRPEYDASWMQRSGYSQISLLPFGPDGVSDLLNELLGDDPSLSQIKHDIGARASGNPFFVEELVLSLVEDGALEGETGNYRVMKAPSQLAIPATVQNILAARIDRIPEDDKNVLQSAAVVGREFTDAILARISDSSRDELAGSLERLANSEFIFARSLYPEAEYVFKHALTQEVAYESQLSDRRSELHAKVASALEEIHADRRQENANIIAHHWERADEPMQAARWHARAAVWMGARDPGQAAHHWNRVSALLAEVQETEETHQLELAATHWMLGWGWRVGMHRDEIRKFHQRGIDLVTRGDDDIARGQLAAVAGVALCNIGDINESKEQVEIARAIAERLENHSLLVSMEGLAAYNGFLAGDPGAGKLYEHFLELADGDTELGRERSGMSSLLGQMGSYAWQQTIAGELDRAEELLAEGRRLSNPKTDAESLAMFTGCESELRCAQGQMEAAKAAAIESLEVAERIGNSAWRANALRRLGDVWVFSKEWAAALETYEIAVQEYSTVNLPMLLSNSLTGLACAQLATGDLDGARRAAERLVSISEDVPGMFMPQIEARITQARVLLKSEDFESDVEHLLDEATEWVERTGARLMAPLVSIERAELAHSRGQTDMREQHLEQARVLYRAMGATGRADRVGQ